MQIKVLRALDDNYMYLIIDEITEYAAVVNPVEPKKVLRKLKKFDLDLKAVLITHHYWDHAGGNAELLKKVKSPFTIYSGDDRICGVESVVKHGEEIVMGFTNIQCLYTPCHSSGHICFVVSDLYDEERPPAVFTGDGVFLSGCGKFFEGSAPQMYTSPALIEILEKLPPMTQVYFGHHHVIDNLKYATHVQPNNKAVIEILEWGKKKREKGEVTLPSTISEEKTYNPLMRIHEIEVQKHAVWSTDPIAVMAFLRPKKGRFKRLLNSILHA